MWIDSAPRCRRVLNPTLAEIHVAKTMRGSDLELGNGQAMKHCRGPLATRWQRARRRRTIDLAPKAKFEHATAASAHLKESARRLQAQLTSLAATQAEMDKMRFETHAGQVQAKPDLEAGPDDVRRAFDMPRGHYGSGVAESMLPQSAAPELHEKAAGAGSSIIGPLEVVKAKVATGLAKEVMPTAGVSVRYVTSTQEKSLPEHHHHFVSPLARLTASASKLHLRGHHHNQ